MSKESLYIVLFLAWILYKVFGKQFFKSLNQKPTTLNPEPETQNSEPKAQRPNYKDLIEKMILGEEFSAPSNTSEDVVENYAQHGDVVENYAQQEENLKLKTQNPSLAAEDISHIKRKFDLKQAFIHSVILNRPYS